MHSKTHLSCRSRKSGFTLIELLVVVAIVAVLAVLAFMAMQKARASAYMAQSMNTIKGLAGANISYAADNGGRYVSTTSWDEEGKQGVIWSSNVEFLSHVTGQNPFVDEQAGKGVREEYWGALLDPVVVRAKEKQWNQIPASYGLNVPPGGWNQPGLDLYRTTASVRYPGQTAAFFTCKDWNAKYSGRFLWANDQSEGKTPTGDIAYRHKDKALVAFFDGHVEPIDMADMKRIDDEQGGKNSIFWGGDGE